MREMRTQPVDESKKKNMIIMTLFVLILAAVLVVVIILAVKKNTEVKNTGNQVENSTELDATGSEKWQEGVVSYNGRRYRYNTAIDTYLFMGIDRNGPVREAENGIDGGQSDAMFLLVADNKAEKLSVIAINRNTMTDVDVYNEAGDYVSTVQMQICLQHGYGDGMRLSNSRSVEAVSRLFYNLPISGYFSLNMDAVPIVNDAVGGVTVEVLEDLESEARNVSLKKGDTVTLTGDEAYVYLRSRDVTEFNSAGGRLERQMQYLNGFFAQAKNTANGDVSNVMNIYDEIEEYLVTNIDFANLAEKVMDYGFDTSNMYSVPGETVMGEQFEEYYVDETALYEMILEVFYEPAEE